MSNGNASRAPPPSIEIIEKLKRRRFSVEEKARILQSIDTCAPGTVGAYLRRTVIYSSQRYACDMNSSVAISMPEHFVSVQRHANPNEN